MTKSFHQPPSKPLESKRITMQSLESTRSKISITQSKTVILKLSTKSDPHSMTSKMSIIKAKVSKYMKEINFKTIVNLKRQVEPSISCFKAAKCLCQILSAFENKPSIVTKQLNEWNDIKSFISNNQYQIMQDIYNLKSKIDKREYDLNKIKDNY